MERIKLLYTRSDSPTVVRVIMVAPHRASAVKASIQRYPKYTYLGYVNS